MANPFLVLGGVAVGVITAGIGVLAVPGWIDNANDSAAMNDLGSIRNAESAAVLHLGSYTDSFGVLESGELGVKFQKSEGVTIVGLQADSNESWCAVTQSKSGKFFAASNVQAAIATAPGAEAAMTTAGCETGAIADIIAEATDPDRDGGPIDVGTPGTDGGELVGGGSGPGAAPEEPIVEPAPLGPVVSLGTPRAVAYTDHGVFTVTDSYTLLRSGPDGLAHQVTLTGDSMPAPAGHHLGMDSDARGNIYVGTMDNGIYRIAPDAVATKITPAAAGFPNLSVSAFATNSAGEVYYVGQNVYGDVPSPRPGIFKRVDGNTYEIFATFPAGFPLPGGTISGMDVDAAGNVVLNILGAGIYRATTDGQITVVASAGELSGQGVSGVSGLTVTDSGTAIYATTHSKVVRIDLDGNASVAATPPSWTSGPPPATLWSDPQGITTGRDGTLFIAERGNGGKVIMVGSDGTSTVAID